MEHNYCKLSVLIYLCTWCLFKVAEVRVTALGIKDWFVLSKMNSVNNTQGRICAVLLTAIWCPAIYIDNKKRGLSKKKKLFNLCIFHNHVMLTVVYGDRATLQRTFSYILFAFLRWTEFVFALVTSQSEHWNIKSLSYKTHKYIHFTYQFFNFNYNLKWNNKMTY